MIPTLPLIPLVLLAAPAPSTTIPARPATPRPTAPEVRVEGYRFVVERFMQQQNLTEEFAADQPPEKGGRQHLYLGLAVYPPDRKLVANVQGLDPRVIAFAVPGGKVITLRSYPAEDAGPVGDGVWRTQLAAQELDLSVSRLSRLQGELVVFPRARRVTLDFPLPINGAATKEAEGFRVTIKNVRTRGNGLTATVDSEWPATHSVAITNPDAPGGITALTAAGTPLIPNGAGTSGATRGGRVLRTQNISLSDLKEQPTKFRVEALVRNGAPQKIPFTFAEIPLPDTLGLEPAAVEAAGEGAQQRHPFFIPAGGGALNVTVTGAAAVRGQLLIGVARVEGGSQGAIRWMELTPDRHGRAALVGLRPGRYRVTLAWSPEEVASSGPPVIAQLPRAARVLGPPAAVEIAAGKAVSLPPVQVGGGR